MRLGHKVITPRKRQNPRKQSRPSNIRDQRSDSTSPVAALTPSFPHNMLSQAGSYPATLHQLAQLSGSYPLLQALQNVHAKTTGDRTDLDVLVEQREFLRRMLEHQEMLRYFWDQQLSMIQHLLSGCEARIMRERSKQNNNITSNSSSSNNNNNNDLSGTKPSTIHHVGQPLPAHTHPTRPKTPPAPPGALSPPGMDSVDGTPLMPWDAELRKLSRAPEALKPRPAHVPLEELSTLCARTNTSPYRQLSDTAPFRQLSENAPYRPGHYDALDLTQNSQAHSTPKSEPSLPRDVPLTIDTRSEAGDAYDFDLMENSMNGDDVMSRDDDQTQDADMLESARRRIRKRTSFSKYQLERLEEEFMNTHYPSSYERETIADALGLNYEQVRIWFKNRRRKEAVMRGMNDFDLKLPHPSQLQVKLNEQPMVSMATVDGCHANQVTASLLGDHNGK